MSAVNLAGTMTGAAAAMSNGTLALGYSGSGFLIYYFLGATGENGLDWSRSGHACMHAYMHA